MNQVLLSLVETRAVYLSTPLRLCKQEKQESENVNGTNLPIPYLAAALGVILEACSRTGIRYHIHIRVAHLIPKANPLVIYLQAPNLLYSLH
jgi:hypothetical protein